jgi:predicted PurR-regulated permease PerM
MRQPTRDNRSAVSIRTVLTICAAVAAVAAIVYVLRSCPFAVTTTLISLVAAAAANHLVARLQWFKLPRWCAILLVALGLGGAITGLVFFLEPVIAAQTKNLVQALPKAARALLGSSWVRRVLPHASNVDAQIGQLIAGAASPALAAVGSVLSFAATVVTTVILTVFMLAFGPSLLHAFLDWFRPDRRAALGSALAQIYAGIGGYLAGLALVCAINGAMTTTFLALVAPGFFVPLGLLSGLSSLVPYAGPLVTGTFISLIAGATLGLSRGLIIAAYFVAYGQLEGHVLAPLILRHTVHVNPLVMLVAILFLAEFAGVVGAILAVPVVIATQIITRMRHELWPGPLDAPPLA